VLVGLRLVGLVLEVLLAGIVEEAVGDVEADVEEADQEMDIRMEDTRVGGVGRRTGREGVGRAVGEGVGDARHFALRRWDRLYRLMGLRRSRLIDLVGLGRVGDRGLGWRRRLGSNLQVGVGSLEEEDLAGMVVELRRAVVAILH